MAEKTLADEIITIIQAEANNNPAPEHCIITKSYEDGSADIKLSESEDIRTYVKTIGDNSVGAEGVICYLNGDLTNPVVIVDNTKQNEINTILALGLGLFTIREDGHLYVELPMGMDNPFSINSNGHLIITLPNMVSNDYELINKHLIYHRRS